MNKDKATGSTIFCMFFAYAIIFISLFYSHYIFYQSTMVSLKENIDNAMNESNLAAMTLDMESFSYIYDPINKEVKVSPYLIDSEVAYEIYSTTICENMNMTIENQGTFIPEQGTRWAPYITSINLVEFVIIDTIYTDSTTLQVTVRDINGWRELIFNNETGFYELGGTSKEPSYCDVGLFITPDGVIIESPSVYSKVELNISSNVLGKHQYLRHNTTSVISK